MTLISLLFPIFGVIFKLCKANGIQIKIELGGIHHEIRYISNESYSGET